MSLFPKKVEYLFKVVYISLIISLDYQKVRYFKGYLFNTLIWYIY